MPRPRIGAIPPTRLGQARKVRDKLSAVVGSSGTVVVTLHDGGYAVLVNLLESRETDIPGNVDGIPVKIKRVKPCP